MFLKSHTVSHKLLKKHILLKIYTRTLWARNKVHNSFYREQPSPKIERDVAPSLRSSDTLERSQCQAWRMRSKQYFIGGKITNLIKWKLPPKKPTTSPQIMAGDGAAGDRRPWRPLPGVPNHTRDREMMPYQPFFPSKQDVWGSRLFGNLPSSKSSPRSASRHHYHRRGALCVHEQRAARLRPGGRQELWPDGGPHAAENLQSGIESNICNTCYALVLGDGRFGMRLL